ncbi:hypothetical protein BU25DRAFT_450492 [Macroventuria anomochaeta]|uniref:Uncharacterized protein n=1 Tax=Macroventuria anomochaeta TaxID=301207 RepID=A0ACB6RSJ6_9PLEO|nr:uncharacterized protein BU25DRAFT_450492 [Macroventuria anomochaeta]KAF2624754.1 hypothetical protein BU25DRAFT_450492 [Macroventuria anomochaeta]
MGNTPSTPPPLVSINAPGNDVLVPYGTSLYAIPPLTPGYHPPHAHGNCKGAGCQGASSCHASAPRGPVYTRVGTRPRRQRHGHTEPDVNIREYEYEEDSRSTELGELPETVRMRKGSKMQGPRQHGGRRGMPGPYDGDPRPSSAPVGYMGMRGGQGYPGMHPGVEDMGVGMGMDPSVMRPGMYPGVYPTGPGMPPHMSVPPQYASHESMHRYPPGMGGMHSANPYAAHPPRPPPPSTSSPPPSPKRISPAVQAAIDAAVQKSAEMAGKSRSTPTRSRTSPAALAKDKNNEWGEGIDTCICTTDCKCRKGERAAGWYEGVADIDGEEVPVRGKLNTRWVLVDDLGKDCGDHTDCKKSSSSSSTSSDTETSQSKSKKKKSDKKKSEKISNAGKLEDLQAEIDKMKKPAGLKQGPSPYTGHGPGLGPSDMEGWHPEMMQQLRMMEMSGDPYRMGRVNGMDATGAMQGKFNPMTMRNLRGPRMPPRPGMRRRYEDDGFVENYEDMGGASPGNPYAHPSAMSAKRRNKDSMQPKGRTGFGLRGGLFDSDSEPSTAIRKNTSKRGGGTLGGRLARSGRNRPHFEFDDTSVSFGPRRQSGMESFGTDEDGEPPMYNLPKRGVGDRDEGASPRNGRSRISPPGGRGGVRSGRTVGKQARAETDDDEDY